MSNKLPGVYTKEIDQSQTTEEVGGSVGLFVGLANKGMVNSRVYVSSQKQLIDTFGIPPKKDNDYAVVGAHEYLSVSPAYFTRVSTDDMKYGKIATVDKLVEADIHVEPESVASNLSVIGDVGSTVAIAEVAGIDTTSGGIYSPYSNVSNEPTYLEDAEKEREANDSLILFSTNGPDSDSDLIGITLENFETYAVSGEASDITIKYKYDMVKSRLGDAVPTYNTETNPAPSTGLVDALSATSGYRFDVVVTQASGILVNTILATTNQRKTAGNLILRVFEGLENFTDVVPNGTRFVAWSSTSAIPSISGCSFTATMSGGVQVVRPYWYAGFDSISGLGDVMVFTSKKIGEQTVMTCPWFDKYDFVPQPVTTDLSLIGKSGYIWQSVFKVNVFVRSDRNSNFSSTPTETFYGTIGDVFSDDGSNLNIENIINGKSKFVYVTAKKDDANDYTNVPKVITSKFNAVLTYNNDIKKASGTWGYQMEPVAFAKGNSGSDSRVGDYQSAYSLYDNKRDTKINIIVQTKPEKAHAVLCDSLIGVRRDCCATIQIGSDTSVGVDAMVNDDTSVSNPSYVNKYAGWVKIYDSYNRKYRFIPMNIMGARTMALCEVQFKISAAPAGVRRGVLPVLGVSKKFTDSEILRLYNKNINTSMWQVGVGHVLWGQRTALALNSALREIQVRRTLLFIENTVESTLNGYVFEGNTPNERLRITGNISSFLSRVKGNDDIQEFLVICNETNNTPDVVDNQELNVAIAITPTRTSEVINVSVIKTKTGVLLSEVQV